MPTSSYLQPGPFVPLASPQPAVDAEVRRLLEQLRPHTERLLALFKEWDDDGCCLSDLSSQNIHTEQLDCEVTPVDSF